MCRTTYIRNLRRVEARLIRGAPLRRRAAQQICSEVRPARFRLHHDTVSDAVERRITARENGLVHGASHDAGGDVAAFGRALAMRRLEMDLTDVHLVEANRWRASEDSVEVVRVLYRRQ